METISFNIEEDIANVIKEEARENFTTVSQYMRKLMTERYRKTAKVMSDSDIMKQIEEGKNPKTRTRDFEEVAKELNI